MADPGEQLAKYLGKDYLFGVARYLLCNYHLPTENLPIIQSLLSAADALGHEEASWLLALVLRGMSTFPTENSTSGYDKSEWRQSLFEGRDSVRALAYFVHLSHGPGFEVELIEGMETCDEPYGYYALAGLYTIDEQEAKAVECYWRAARGGVGEAYYKLAINDPCYSIGGGNLGAELHLKAAQLGCLRSMKSVRRDYAAQHEELILCGENHLEAAKWLARLCRFDRYEFETQTINGYTDFSPPKTKQDVEIAFAMGREFDGYFELIPSLKDGSGVSDTRKYIDFHRKIAGAARSAALFVLVGFKALIHKDICLVIAKLVYASRLEPFFWYRR